LENICNAYFSWLADLLLFLSNSLLLPVIRQRPLARYIIALTYAYLPWVDVQVEEELRVKKG